MNNHARPLRRSPSNRAHTASLARSATSASVGLRCAMAAFMVAALGCSTGCYEWTPVRAMGVPGEKLDKQLEGQDIRFDFFERTIEAKVVAARTPYVDVRGPRDQVTGERPVNTLDLRDMVAPEVKVVNRPARIAAIVGGSAAGAALIGVIIGVLVTNANKPSGKSTTLDINLGGHYD